MKRVRTFLVDWLMAENERAGCPNYVGVGIMSALMMLAMLLCLWPIVEAVHNGQPLSGYETSIDRVTGKEVQRPLRDYLIPAATAPLWGVFVVVAIACHRGSLDRYASPLPPDAEATEI